MVNWSSVRVSRSNCSGSKHPKMRFVLLFLSLFSFFCILFLRYFNTVIHLSIHIGPNREPWNPEVFHALSRLILHGPDFCRGMSTCGLAACTMQRDESATTFRHVLAFLYVSLMPSFFVGVSCRIF